jgi:hypothetical protein
VRIAGHGLSVDLPSGWEGRISRRDGGGPVMHVATFSLLATDGDFGAAATGRMRPGNAFAALLEFRDEDKLAPGVGLFEAAGQPVPRAREFSPRQLQVTRRGQLGWQRFFTAGGRTSCLYAVVAPGPHTIDELVGALGVVLATVERAAVTSAAGGGG